MGVPAEFGKNVKTEPSVWSSASRRRLRYRAAPDPAHDRIMICGGPEMLADLVALAKARGFEEGSGGKPGSYVIEKAFVEK